MEEKTSCSENKILIVEDEKPARLALKAKLTKEGFTVVEAQNGKDGLDVAKKEKPDLMLLDVKMPVMTGVELLAILKEDEELSRIKVVVLTNDSTTDTMTQALIAGGTHYFVKADTSLDTIIGKVKLMLNCQ